MERRVAWGGGLPPRSWLRRHPRSPPRSFFGFSPDQSPPCLDDSHDEEHYPHGGLEDNDDDDEEEVDNDDGDDEVEEEVDDYDDDDDDDDDDEELDDDNDEDQYHDDDRRAHHDLDDYVTRHYLHPFLSRRPAPPFFHLTPSRAAFPAVNPPIDNEDDLSCRDLLARATERLARSTSAPLPVGAILVGRQTLHPRGAGRDTTGRGGGGGGGGGGSGRGHHGTISSSSPPTELGWDMRLTVLESDGVTGEVKGRMYAVAPDEMARDVTDRYYPHRHHLTGHPPSTSTTTPAAHTYWTGHRVQSSEGFETGRWMAGPEVDLLHWARFKPFRRLLATAKEREKEGESPGGGGGGGDDDDDDVARRYVFLRIKETFFVDPPPKNTLTISGFYYGCYDRVSGRLDAFYHDPHSTPFQHLALETLRSSFSSIQFA